MWVELWCRLCLCEVSLTVDPFDRMLMKWGRLGASAKAWACLRQRPNYTTNQRPVIRTSICGLSWILCGNNHWDVKAKQQKLLQFLDINIRHSIGEVGYFERHVVSVFVEPCRRKLCVQTTNCLPQPPHALFWFKYAVGYLTLLWLVEVTSGCPKQSPFDFPGFPQCLLQM